MGAKHAIYTALNFLSTTRAISKSTFINQPYKQLISKQTRQTEQKDMNTPPPPINGPVTVWNWRQ